jgi:hypothetical protein
VSPVQQLLLLNWVRATHDRPFMSSLSSSQPRLIGHKTVASSEECGGLCVREMQSEKEKQAWSLLRYGAYCTGHVVKQS